MECEQSLGAYFVKTRRDLEWGDVEDGALVNIWPETAGCCPSGYGWILHISPCVSWHPTNHALHRNLRQVCSQGFKSNSIIYSSHTFTYNVCWYHKKHSRANDSSLLVTHSSAILKTHLMTGWAIESESCNVPMFGRERRFLRVVKN